MSPDAPAADTGILTVEQATADLTAAEEKKEAPAAAVAEAAPAVAEDADAAPEAGAADGGVTEDDGAAADGADPAEAGEADGAQPEEEPLEPPKFWSAEDKEKFKALPRDLQEITLKYENQRTTVTSKALEEAAAKRKAAEGEASRLTQVMGALDQLLPQAVQTFKSRWEGVDWNKVVDQYGADAALKLRNDMEREQGVIQQLQTAKDQAEQIRFAKFVEAETAKLPQVAPDLADPKLGSQRRAELGKFLVGAGVSTDVIPHMTALEASLAYDAMQWRNAQAKAKAVHRTNTAAQPAKPAVRPTAAPSQRDPQSARVQALKSKRSLTIDEAVELANLQGD